LDAEPATRSVEPDLYGVFDAAMARLSPFETRPDLAVAVSGGPDSMALALLARDWAAARGGAVHGLIVDHGLRAGSAAEVCRTAGWLERAGIPATILTWDGPKPTTGIQETARAARYARLEGWCRRHGVLHLLLGHHRDDQDETVAHRAERGSGPTGLAGMAAAVERPDLRLLRPLLGVNKAEILALLTARGEEWIEDPSNRNPAFARARLRRDGIPALPLGDFAPQRRERERAGARLLAAAVRLDAAGWAILDAAAFKIAPRAAARDALAAVLRTVAGAPYPPRSARLERLLDVVAEDRLGGGRTLAGCRLLPWRGDLLVAREPHAVETPRTLGAQAVLWDGRFRVRGPTGWRVEALGERRPGGADRERVPSPARAALPVLCDEWGPAVVPHLGWMRDGVEPDRARVVFAPRWPLAGAPFATAR